MCNVNTVKPLTVKLLVDFNGPIAICIQQLEETDSFDAVEFHTWPQRVFETTGDFAYEKSQVCVFFWGVNHEKVVEPTSSTHFLE